MTNAEIGLIPGTVTAKKVRSRPAPSRAAASYCSAGTFCRAARKKIVRYPTVRHRSTNPMASFARVGSPSQSMFGSPNTAFSVAFSSP